MCGTLDERLFGWSMDPTNDQTTKTQKYGKLTVHSLLGRHHTLGCQPSELDVDLPGRHPAVSPVDIMAVMSIESTGTWCQASGGSRRVLSVSGRHHGRDVDRVHYISAMFWKSRFQLFPVFSCVPGRPRQGPVDRVHAIYKISNF